ncbi:MAG TPA: hypothetical protein VFV00_08495 [Acidimicrobiales bacterium]|nr:hypothetical protein [Acidimicrobiales bacterium]
MSNLRNLAPWALFSIGCAIADWRVAAPSALAVCVANAIARRQAGETADEMAVAGMVFFGAVTILSGADPTSPVRDYLPALTAAAIGAAMLVSVVRGQPFTLPFARRSTPPAIWDDPRFVQANAIISMVWAISVLATAAALALLHATAPHAVTAALAVQVAGFVVPMRFTKIYRGQLRARFAAA